MERSTIVKFGKASISMGHLYRFHGYVSHTQRVNIYPNIIKHELNIPHHPHGEVIPRLQGGAQPNSQIDPTRIHGAIFCATHLPKMAGFSWQNEV